MKNYPFGDSRFLVVSIKHTGTRFTETLLGCGHLHINCNTRTIWNYAPKYKGNMVVPMRDPKKIWMSWHNRERSRDKDFNYFCGCWKQMEEFVNDFDPLFLPVDHPERDKYLEAINSAFDLELTTDWTPVTDKHGEKNDAPLVERDLDWIYDLPFMMYPK